MTRLFSICASGLLIAAASSASAYTTIYTLNCPSDGCQPQAGITYSQGKLHGPTVFGSLYRVAPSGANFFNMYQLNNSPDGMKPVAALTKHAGELYGVAESGGSAPNGAGSGTIFKIDPATNSFQWLHQFNGTDGRQPRGQLLKVNTGGQTVMYGTSFSGGPVGSQFGSIFKFDVTSQSILQVYNLNPSTEGSYPTVGLARHINFLYGTTSRGGLFNGGTLFRIDLSLGSMTILHHFGAASGILPSSRLLVVGNLLYGTTMAGGSNSGGILYRFNLTTPGLNVLYNFGSVANDGSGPSGDLAEYSGKIYGTTQGGGTWNRGTLFRVDPATLTNTTLHHIGTFGNDGSFPMSGVVKRSGILYGTTSRSPGTIFSHPLP